MNNLEESDSNNLENITDGLCFYAIISLYYIPAFFYQTFKRGINFLDQKSLPLSD